MSHLRCVPHRPESLEASVAHAERFVRALRALPDVTVIEEASLWLEGRHAEVEVFVEDVLSAWKLGEIKAESAARAIDDYLLAWHSTLEVWFGPWYAPSCCGPMADARERTIVDVRERQHDSLNDTHPDGTPSRIWAKSTVSHASPRRAIVG